MIPAKDWKMPPFPVDKFGVEQRCSQIQQRQNGIRAPPFGPGATLYIRPYMFGSNPVIGVKPADEYQFRILTTPVGPYFKGGAKPLTIKVSDFDRAAPHGTGHIKAGLNYAMSLHAIVTAHKEGLRAENMYLDLGNKKSSGGMMAGGATSCSAHKTGTVVTPQSQAVFFLLLHVVHSYMLRRKF
ncbi:MAG: hypothetical protein ACLTH3_02515 [Lachnospira sp.]